MQIRRREALFSIGALGGASLAAEPETALAAGDERRQPQVGNMTPAMAAALQRYNEKLLSIQSKIWNHPWTARADVNALANAYYMELLGQAWMMVLSGNELYPRFVSNTYCEPQLANVLFMCPDFKYFSGSLDPTKTYRIRGRMRESAFLDFSISCDLGAFDPPQKVAEVNTASDAPYYYAIGEEFKAGPDGSFEIIASAKPQSGNWMRMSEKWPMAHVTIRNGILDWTNDRPAWLDVQLLDPIERRTLDLPEAAFIQRMDRAGRYIDYYYQYFANYLVEMQFKNAGSQFNVWAVQHMPKSFGQTQKGRPQNLVYDIAEDEALIIEHEDPGPLYWGFQLADRYARGTDPAYFQSSLNAKQARKDADGRYRVVVANHDPGVPNWLDTAGRLTGILRLRQYHQEKDVATPTARKVKLADVRRQLPAETPTVSREERAKVVEVRRQGILRRFGHLPYDEPLLT
jgi:hypothetical protein